MSYNETYNNYLQHHGILGMHWGKKNGPPCPLGYSEHSSAEKSQNPKSTIDGKASGGSSSSRKSNADSKTSVDQKVDKDYSKYVKIGAAAIATGLAAAGTIYLVKSGKAKNLLNSGKIFLSGDSNNEEASSLKIFKKLKHVEDLSETIKAVNPNRGNFLYKNNCTSCCVAAFLRRNSKLKLNVIAKPTGGKQQILGGIIENCFKGATVLDGSAIKFGKSVDDAKEMLIKKFGKNAAGVCSIQYKNGGGHAFNWEIKDGIVKFFDGQDIMSDINYEEFIDDFWHKIDTNGGLTLARLDNAEIIEEALMNIVE